MDSNRAGSETSRFLEQRALSWATRAFLGNARFLEQRALSWRNAWLCRRKAWLSCRSAALLVQRLAFLPQRVAFLMQRLLKTLIKYVDSSICPGIPNRLPLTAPLSTPEPFST
jgi:hypothetical protein